MDTVVLKNVELRWPFLAKKNEVGEFASGKYQVDIVVDGENLKTIESMKNKKQKIKERDGVSSITLKSTKKPRVLDKTGAVMSDEDLAAIGNGTKAHVKVTQYTAGKFGDYLGLGPIKIIDLHSYAADDDFGDDDDFTEDAAAGEDDELI